MRKIIIMTLLFITVLSFTKYIYANTKSSVKDIKEIILNSEFEEEHMLMHKNAEKYRISNIILQITIVILTVCNIIAFSILALKSSKIDLKYFTSLVIIILIYIIGHITLIKMYPSDIAPVRFEFPTIIFFVSIGAFLGIIIKPSVLKFFISSLPPIIILGIGLISNYLIDNTISNGFFSIKLILMIIVCIQIILIPLYIFNIKNKTKQDDF